MIHSSPFTHFAALQPTRSLQTNFVEHEHPDKYAMRFRIVKLSLPYKMCNMLYKFLLTVSFIAEYATLLETIYRDFICL